MTKATWRAPWRSSASPIQMPRTTIDARGTPTESTSGRVSCVAACRPGAPFRLSVERDGRVSRFRLVGAPGARINARLKPALELADGTVLRFDSPHLTPDSAYFAEPPTVVAPRGADLKHGTLRASICPPGERYCRELVLPVDL